MEASQPDWTAVVPRRKDSGKSALKYSHHRGGKTGLAYICDLCNIPCPCWENLQAHFKGKRHQSAWLEFKTGKNQGESIAQERPKTPPAARSAGTQTARQLATEAEAAKLKASHLKAEAEKAQKRAEQLEAKATAASQGSKSTERTLLAWKPVPLALQQPSEGTLNLPESDQDSSPPNSEVAAPPAQAAPARAAISIEEDSGAAAYDCVPCKKIFSSAEEQTLHRLASSHSTGVRNYSEAHPGFGSTALFKTMFACSVCDISTSGRTSLRDHIQGRLHQSNIQEAASYFCVACDKKLASQGQMDRHCASLEHLQRLQQLTKAPIASVTAAAPPQPPSEEAWPVLSAGTSAEAANDGGVWVNVVGKAARRAATPQLHRNPGKAPVSPRAAPAVARSKSMPKASSGSEWAILDGFECPTPTWDLQPKPAAGAPVADAGEPEKLTALPFSRPKPIPVKVLPGAARALAAAVGNPTRNPAGPPGYPRPAFLSNPGMASTPAATADPYGEDLLAQLLGNLMPLPPAPKPAAVPIAAQPAPKAETRMMSSGLFQAQQVPATRPPPAKKAPLPKANPLTTLITCPISKETMADPVIARDGHTYDRLAILAWIAQHQTSPVTGQALTDTEVTPNRIVKQILAGMAGS